MNVSANLLGLGNAATPMAISAISRMDDGNPRASVDMIMLTVISATSLQILPTTVIGMRAAAGSANPADFLFPSLIATVLSTLIGIVGVKLCSKIFDRDKTRGKARKAERARKRAARKLARERRATVNNSVTRKNASSPRNTEKAAQGGKP